MDRLGAERGDNVAARMGHEVSTAGVALAYQRHRMLDPGPTGGVREVDCWIGTRQAWAESTLARGVGWSVGYLPDGLVVALRLR